MHFLSLQLGIRKGNDLGLVEGFSDHYQLQKEVHVCHENIVVYSVQALESKNENICKMAIVFL